MEASKKDVKIQPSGVEANNTSRAEQEVKGVPKTMRLAPNRRDRFPEHPPAKKKSVKEKSECDAEPTKNNGLQNDSV